MLMDACIAMAPKDSIPMGPSVCGLRRQPNGYPTPTPPPPHSTPLQPTWPPPWGTKMPPGTLPGPQGRPRDENDAKMTPNRPSKDPQGTPRGAPETPKGGPRTPKRAPGDPQGPRIGLQRSPRAPQGRTRDENDAKMTPNRPSNDAKTVPR